MSQTHSAPPHPAVAAASADIFNAGALDPRQRLTVYVLCGLAGIAEGIGIQSAGMAAPKFAAEFHMLPDHVGAIFLLTSLGLALGAGIGGWWGDRIGAGRAMGLAVALFGVASFGSALAPSAASLAGMRTLAGLGLGGGLPNMIALLTHVGPGSSAPRRVTLSIAGISGGALLVALLVLFASATSSWRVIFHLGGGFALLVAALLALFLPGVSTAPTIPGGTAGAAVKRWHILFAGQYLLTTLLFWLAFFVTAATSYLLINWMPTFLVRSGMHQHEVGIGMIGLAGGSAAGPILLAGLLRPGRLRFVMCLAYVGIVLGLLSLISAPKTIFYLSLATTFTGFFAAGTQAVLFGIIGPFYPASVRGTGVGSAVAVGRIGSGAGPALAGVMLTAGSTQESVLAAVMPLLVLALAALLLLLRAPPQALRVRG